MKVLNLWFLVYFSSVAYAGDMPFEVPPAKFILTQKTPGPTVIVAHGCDGVGGYAYTQWAKDIYGWGYNTLIYDSFGRRGFRDICTNGLAVTPQDRALDLIKVAEYIRSQTWHSGNIAVIGFSHGGSTVIAISNLEQKQINSVIAYYPGCNQSVLNIGLFRPYRPKIPIQIHLGLKDDWTPASECYFLKEEETERFEYADATHAFDANLPERTVIKYKMRYDPEADALAKQRSKDFLRRKLKIDSPIVTQ